MRCGHYRFLYCQVCKNLFSKEQRIMTIVIITFQYYVNILFGQRNVFRMSLIKKGCSFAYLVETSTSFLQNFVMLMSTTARKHQPLPEDMLAYHFTYLILWIPYPSTYLKPEKGTLVGQKLSVEVLIESTPPVLGRRGGGGLKLEKFVN